MTSEGAMFEQVAYQEQRAVAVAASETSAELVAATLAVHGVEATVASPDRAYPAVSWVEGYRVVVAAGDEERARDVLGALSGETPEGIDIPEED